MKIFNCLLVVLLLVNAALYAQVADEFLVLDIDFNDDILVDKSINAHPIIDHGTEFGAGIEGVGLLLSGENYLEIPHAATLELPNVVTTSIWYRHQPQTSNGFFPLIEQSANVFGGHSRHGSWVFQGNRIQTCIEPDFCAGGATLCQRCVSSSEILEEDKWHHIVSIYDGAVLKIYVNGSLNARETFSPSTGISVLPYSLTIGYDMYSQGSNFLKGNLDEAKIFNTVLSDTEIGQLYSAFVMTHTEAIPKNTFSIYPNPTSNWLMIDAAFKIETVRIFNTNGQLLQQLQNVKGKKIDTALLPQGWYLLQLTNSNQAYTKRFFIKR